MIAPAFKYDLLVNPLPNPASSSIYTIFPSDTRSDAPEGVKATRFSLSFISLGTPTILL